MGSLKNTRSLRKDIQGLRAIAVLAVMFFHFQIPGFSGGFFGVDIFFVISGYLMTAIIVGGLETGSFSFSKFYLARGRRIIPPLLILVFSLLFLGWFALSTYDYQELASGGNYALTFTSNLKFWRTAGYFDTTAHAKWFLHTWSLSVEWQFYILYPVYLFIFWKIRPDVHFLFKTIFFLFLTSFLASCIISPRYPDFAFYQLPIRAWELACGGLLVQVGRSHKVPNFFQGMGWLLLVLSFFLLNASFTWPGAWALLPVLGTMMLMLGGDKKKYLLENGVLQWIGDRSYSVYLWHWPFVVILFYLELQKNWLWVLVGFASSFVLGHFSFQLVEKPWRRFFVTQKVAINFMSLFIFFLVVYSCSMVARRHNFVGRLTEEVEIASMEAKNQNPRRNACFGAATSQGSPGCLFGTGEVGAILIGDSHAMSAVTGLEKAAGMYGKSVLFWGLHSCPPIHDVMYLKKPKPPHETYDACKNFNLWIASELEKYSAVIPLVMVARFPVYIAGSKNIYDENVSKEPLVYFSKEYMDANDPIFQKEYQDALVNTICRFTAQRPVYVVRPMHEVEKHVPRVFSRNLAFRKKAPNLHRTREQYENRNRVVLEALERAEVACGAQILDPLPYFCDTHKCFGVIENRPVFFDNNHLSEYGSQILIPMFEEIFQANTTDSTKTISGR